MGYVGLVTMNAMSVGKLYDVNQLGSLGRTIENLYEIMNAHVVKEKARYQNGRICCAQLELGHVRRALSVRLRKNG